MAMKDPKQLALLAELVHIDLDAVTVYDAALRIVNVPVVEQALMEFRSDHLRHVRELNDRIEWLGGARARSVPDSEACQRHGFSAVQDGLRTEELVTALAEGEQVTNAAYARVLKVDWDEETRALLDLNFADEQRHLQWVLMAARSRLWEQGAPQPGA
ncbi:ferritin-like domain-containing protein [Aggregicoccus sp. 17bor-14]|uniref:ferritin-like domain-containing protein n=1 Tax=Myxococcaceae TaxID=31 RepID=UPI00129C9281|nr:MULTISPECIES: ferritin-like domain-containing protein [Myxococcaceae]MBF5041842.1 ferritin-like domain-containing protein [Simulacricoccus sp. 17bor-14]MRI87623.1 ferritin-like domain-containing protein [Aggregicoccus sp. 17bor-14]